MNILFLSLIEFESIQEHNIYTDLLREFKKNGHSIYAISPIERRNSSQTKLIKEDGVNILRVKIGNIQKTGFVEKGISTILLEHQLIKGIKKYFPDIKFDLVLYPTPPITLLGAVRYIKHRDKAKTYLLLKDIFPQNSVDLGILRKNGFKGIIYKYFRRKEKQLYQISDHIGCMSRANVDYILKHNEYISADKVSVCPNCIEVQDISITEEERKTIRQKYNIPLDKKVFVYGGNLGKPQGIPFIIECLRTQEDNEDAFFLIIGSGTEYHKLENYFKIAQPTNMKLMNSMPKEDYDTMIAACDVGMIFLDYRFTIPNFPSRLLGYMQAKLPVLAVTDEVTDIGRIITDAGFGWWCGSDDSNKVGNKIKEISFINIDAFKKEKALRFLMENYSEEHCYKMIIEHIK